MTTLTQYVVDAFTDKIFAGNPAAVCVMDRWLPDALMQKIAIENNLSETAFAVKVGDLYHLRWFTPGGEIELCGHATLATAYVVTRKDDLFSLEFPTFPLREVEEADVLEAVEKAIGVKPAKIYMGPIWSACLRAKKGSCGSPRPSACARSRRCVPARDGASEGRRIRLHHALLRAQVRRSRRPCLRARSLPRRLDLGEGARQIRAHRVSGFGSRRRPLLPL